MNKIFMLVMVTSLAACGGDDGNDIGPGDQSYNPPNQQTGGGVPSGATSVTCTQGEDCGYWYCQCADGFVVNSALCSNGYCMDAASQCQDACTYFSHGAWTGAAGGGPSQPPPTSSTCGGLGSSKAACDSCMHDSCCDEASACGNNSSCLNYWDCYLACDGDSLCQSDCEDAYPSGVSPYQGLHDCLIDACYSECVGDL